MLERTGGLGALVAAFVLFAIAAGSAQAESCQLRKLADLPITEVDRQLIFDAIVGNQNVKVAFLDDPGPFALITDEAANRLGLQRKPLDNSDNPYAGWLGRAVLDKLLIGKLAVESLNPKITATALPGGADLALGPKSLDNVDMEIDLSHESVRLFASDHCPGKVVYWSDGWFELPFGLGLMQQPVISTEVNGHQIPAAINFTLPETALTPYGAWSSEVPDRAPDQRYAVKSLEFGGIKLRNVSFNELYINLQSSTWEKTSRASAKVVGLQDLNIGRDLLRRLRLYISRQDSKIYFTLAGG